jgi:hypothetical protein
MKIADLLTTSENTIQEGDNFDIELEGLLIETYVIGFAPDGIIINADETALAYLETEGKEFKTLVDLTRNIAESSSLEEAEYQGRNVSLGKPMSGDVKKSKVYVRKPNGNIVKVNFGDKKMRIKKSNPGRRKSFRARHNCENPGPRWKARYWSCRAW